MSTPISGLVAKEEKALTAIAETVGSTLGSLAAKVSNAAIAVLSKPAVRRRPAKSSRKAARKAVRGSTKSSAKRPAAKTATAKGHRRKAVRPIREVAR